MLLEKSKLFEIISNLNDPFESEELEWRLFLLEKLEESENDFKHGRLLTHESIIKETSQWFRK